MELDKENVVQAVVLGDTFNNNFYPISGEKSLALFPMVGVPLIDFVLESLAQGGVGETILFCCQDVQNIKDHIKKCIEKKASWSLIMEVHVKTSDSCLTMGDAMREIDASGIIKGPFILTGVNTISNIPYANLLEQHKQICKKDKGAAMTILYTKVTWGHDLINFDHTIFLATDGKNNKVLMHQKYKPKCDDETKTINLPLETVLNHSEVKLFHNLIDANIAFCSPSVPPLFSDNFDFQSKDDFVHGILINEEILQSSLYYTILKGHHYAASVSNWKTYQRISRDILHHWAYPLSIETGNFSKDNHVFMGNHSYRHKDAKLSRSCKLGENVLIGEHTVIHDNTIVTKSIIGKNCEIAENVTIIGSHILDNVVINADCFIRNSYVSDKAKIMKGVSLKNGTMIGSDVTVTPLESEKNIILKENAGDVTASNDFTEKGFDLTDDFVGFDDTWDDHESYCTSVSSEDQGETAMSDVSEQEDTNMFLQEVIDSLARGYEEKLKCDYLILEINSSRYAYNILLHEVNFYVVRALLSMPALTENKNVLNELKSVLKYFKPILSNYIKSKSSIMDCLKAVEDSCSKCEWLDGRAGQVIHLLYDYDIIDEDSLTTWYDELKENESPIASQPSLVKFFAWLQEASEESDDSD